MEGTILKERGFFPCAGEGIFPNRQTHDNSCSSLSKLTFIRPFALYLYKHLLSPQHRSLSLKPPPWAQDWGRGCVENTCKSHRSPTTPLSPAWEQNSPANSKYLEKASLPWQEMARKVPPENLKKHLRKMKCGRLS